MNTMSVIAIFLNEIRGRHHCLVNQGFGKELWGPTMLGIILARNQETQGEVVGQPYNHAKLINKEQSQLSLAPSFLLMLQVTQGYTSGSRPRHCKGVTID